MMMMMMRVIQRKKTHKILREESQKIFLFLLSTLCFETRRILVTFKIAHQSR